MNAKPFAYRLVLATAVSLLLVIAHAHGSDQEGSISSNVVSLEGLAKFNFGDNPEWAAPAFDDSGWDDICVPQSWLSDVDPWTTQLAGWYRFDVEFSTASSQWAQPAVCVGVISDAAEVFFNGVAIGGQGKMSPHGDGWPHDVLVLDIPTELIRYDKSNLVAVRVHRTILDGGIIEGPLAVGPRSDLDSLVAQDRLRAWYLDGVVVCFIAITFGYSLLLYVAGMRESVYAWLALSTFMLFISGLVESRSIYDAFEPSTLRRTIEVCSLALLPLCTHAFLAAFYGQHVRRRVWIIQVVVVAFLCVAGPFVSALTATVAVWSVYQLTLLAIWLYWGVKAAIARTPDATPMLIGLSVICVVFVAEMIGLEFAGRFEGQYSSSLSIIFFFGCGMVAMTQRFQRARTRAQQATAAVLTAHEEERKRIARELHDGVVQSLLAIQLHLQMLRGSQQAQEPIDPESLDRVVDEIRSAGDELRRVSHDLRPETLERMELGEAIRLHARRFEKRVDFEIHVSIDELVISPHLKDNLYRIYQESLFNAVKHSQASRAEVKLRRVGSRILMSIQDDGRGFEMEGNGDGRFGVGLTTIRERAELLGGRATIASSSAGTTITIDAPLRDEP